MADQILTQEFLHSIFDYKDGVLYKKPKTKRCKSNIVVGAHHGNGYYKTSINYKKYYIHRLIYMMFYGEFPVQIDHIDGNRSNNKIENLRTSSNTQNNQNKPLTKANKSGCKNVYWHNSANKWSVSIQVYGKKLYLGLFEDIELADLVAQEARNKYHKEFAKHF